MFHFGAKMKLDPKDLKFAEPIELSEMLNGQHRTEIRDAVKRSLANLWPTINLWPPNLLLPLRQFWTFL
jgi:hypothetical protein